MFSVLLITFNANAGSDGELKLNKDEPENIKDCFEKLNRATFAFNQGLDKAIIKPIAKGYKKLPSPVQSGINNFLSNLRAPLVVVNQLLQGQGENAIQSSGRFILNSTVGVFGLFDVAE